jgi:hypothetical protein
MAEKIQRAVYIVSCLWSKDCLDHIGAKTNVFSEGPHTLKQL